MGEVDGYPPLGRGDDLPDAVLVAGVDVGEGGAGDGPIGRVYDAATSILTSPLVGVKLITNPYKCWYKSINLILVDLANS